MLFAKQLEHCRILPVITARDVTSTVLLAQALVRGGMRAVEITLRTPAALDSLRAVKMAVPGILVAEEMVVAGDWDQIESLARRAMADED